MFSEQKANISIVGLFNYFYINVILIQHYKKSPNFFNNNINIKSVQGIFPYSIWAVNNSQSYISEKKICRVLDFYSQNNISVDLIFDNKYINKDELNDTYSNLILKLAHNKNNSVTLSSPILKSYIEKNYPLYKIKVIDESDNFGKKNIVVAPCYNNTEKLNNIKYKEDVDLILNPICKSDCKYYDIHRTYMMKEQKEFYKLYKNEFICPLNSIYNIHTEKNNSNFITIENLNNYLKKGFINFKIDEQNILSNTNIIYNDFDIVEEYIYYLIKPEYKSIIRKSLIKAALFKYKQIQEKTNGK